MLNEYNAEQKFQIFRTRRIIKNFKVFEMEILKETSKKIIVINKLKLKILHRICNNEYLIG